MKLDSDQQVEVYKMIDKRLDANDQMTDKTVIVKRMDYTFQDKECKIISITDLTAYLKL